MNNFKFFEKIPSWIRWILYIPLPFIIARIIVVVGLFSIRLVIGSDFSADSDSIIYSSLFTIYDTVMPAILLCYISYVIAPKKKLLFSLIQPIIYIILMIVVVTTIFSNAIYQGYSINFFNFNAILTYTSIVLTIISVGFTFKELIKLENLKSNTTKDFLF